MKKSSLFILFLWAMSFNASSQEYRKFKFGVGLSALFLEQGKIGTFITLEPGYRLSNRVAAGLRIEAGILGGAPGGIDALSLTGSVTANIQYYLNDQTFRPFIGGGLGAYGYGNDNFVYGFGLYPRIGFDLVHFYMSVDYNFLSGMSKSYTYDLSSYPHFTVGGYFGGGKK